MSDQAGVAYLYENVGFRTVLAADQAGVAYLYDNVAPGGPVWTIGRVGFAVDDTPGVAYLYENVT